MVSICTTEPELEQLERELEAAHAKNAALKSRCAKLEQLLARTQRDLDAHITEDKASTSTLESESGGSAVLARVTDSRAAPVRVPGTLGAQSRGDLIEAQPKSIQQRYKELLQKLRVICQVGRYSVVGDPADEEAIYEELAATHPTVSLLEAAILEHDVDAAVMRVHRGDDPNARNGSGLSPLHFAIRQGSDECALALLEHCGANALLPTAPGNEAERTTALHMVSEHGRAREIIEALCATGGKCDMVDANGNTALVTALLDGRVKVAAALLDAQADVMIAGLDDTTALHAAAGLGESTMVGRILRRGADVAAVDTEGRTAMHWAAESNQPGGVEALTCAGPGIESARMVGGITPLMVAAKHGSHLIVAKLLLDHDPEIDARCDKNKNAMRYALELLGRASEVAKDKGEETELLRRARLVVKLLRADLSEGSVDGK